MQASPGAYPGGLMPSRGPAFLGKHSRMGTEGITSIESERKEIWVSVEAARHQVPEVILEGRLYGSPL